MTAKEFNLMKEWGGNGKNGGKKSLPTMMEARAGGVGVQLSVHRERASWICLGVCCAVHAHTWLAAANYDQSRLIKNGSYTSLSRACARLCVRWGKKGKVDGFCIQNNLPAHITQSISVWGFTLNSQIRIIIIFGENLKSSSTSASERVLDPLCLVLCLKPSFLENVEEIYFSSIIVSNSGF